MQQNLNVRATRADNVQPNGESIISNRGGVELIKQAQQKQQRFPSHADYLRYLKSKPFVQLQSAKSKSVT